ncbi:hypothetical protein [Mesorhizobium sp.]|uniref:hypothetical protein n=1 Tax=Mesorhizobium sp. TaxID=1871066 RepID=UPI0025CEE7B1|nr:hypothetical protein [Mesorhizobium sp.]
MADALGLTVPFPRKLIEVGYQIRGSRGGAGGDVAGPRGDFAHCSSVPIRGPASGACALKVSRYLSLLVFVGLHGFVDPAPIVAMAAQQLPRLMGRQIVRFDNMPHFRLFSLQGPAARLVGRAISLSNSCHRRIPFCSREINRPMVRRFH